MNWESVNSILSQYWIPAGLFLLLIILTYYHEIFICQMSVVLFNVNILYYINLIVYKTLTHNVDNKIWVSVAYVLCVLILTPLLFKTDYQKINKLLSKSYFYRINIFLIFIVMFFLTVYNYHYILHNQVLFSDDIKHIVQNF